ncbi:alcohol dehydrogenase GroES-associated [Haematococcus lacustris]|uniref:Alcohol dehydrogenase GroES-associated n=1 Tax=Haematococcus lacustris TaxID=44745 RepID=A0A699ZBS4_HAELA|nr:alcohol dehydrogenase GroES-associated [Haematococcus lacustris]
MASLSDLPKLGDMAGHPFQTNPQTDTSKVTKADNPTGTSVVTVNAKKHEDLPPMKAVCWYGKHDVRVVDRPRPAITDSGLGSFIAELRLDWCDAHAPAPIRQGAVAGNC